MRAWAQRNNYLPSLFGNKNDVYPASSFFLLAVVRINVQSRGLAFLYILGANANYPSASLVPKVDQSMHIFTQIALWHGDCLKLRCCLDYRCTVRETVHKPFLQALVVSPLAPSPAAGSERG